MSKEKEIGTKHVMIKGGYLPKITRGKIEGTTSITTYSASEWRTLQGKSNIEK